MNNIFEYINNNSFLTTIIGVILGWLLTTLTSIRERKIKNEEELKKEQRRQFENKAELYIDNSHKINENVPGIYLFMSNFSVEVFKESEEVKFYYPKDILNRKKYKHKQFYIRNIGNADINQLDICVSSQKHNMLTNVETLKYIVENNSIDYNYCYDRKIMKNSFIMIDIAYLDENSLGQLLLLFKDSYNNLYQQPFFINQSNLYEPRKINPKDYRLSVTTNTAIECFLNPMLW